MAADIATKEPTQIRAGDTIKWEKTLDDYPAGGSEWVLKYAFRGTAGVIDVTATADGTDHLVSIAPATSTSYASGHYDVLGFVEKGSDRYTIFTGRIEGSSYDGRTHTKKVLDKIEAVLESRATKEILESMIEGVQIKRIPHEELILMRSKYLQWHQQEIAAEKIAAGMGTGRNILARFQ